MGWRSIREALEKQSWQDKIAKEYATRTTVGLQQRLKVIDGRKIVLIDQFPDWKSHKSSPAGREITQLEEEREQIVLELVKRNELRGITGARHEKTKAETRIGDFISRVSQSTGRRIIKKDVWMVAGYTNATEFERFQRDDPRATASAKKNFERVLQMGPEDFVRMLDMKKDQLKGGE